jgi:hypothetical protein
MTARTEYFDIVFEQGIAQGWVFGISEAFRDQLDIEYSKLVDRKKSLRLRQQPRDQDGPTSTVYRMAWTRGTPPLLSFATGQIFFDPPDARSMVWADALIVMRRTVQVVEARSDELPGSGWVKVKVCHYDDGAVVETRDHNMSQVEFVTFLKTGRLAAGHENDQEAAVSLVEAVP